MAFGFNKILNGDFFNNFGVFFAILGISTLISLGINRWIKRETLELTKIIISKNLAILLVLAFVFSFLWTIFANPTALRSPLKEGNNLQTPQNQQAQILEIQKVLAPDDLEIVKKEYPKLGKISDTGNTELDKIAKLIELDYAKYYQFLTNYQAKVVELDSKLEKCVVENPSVGESLVVSSINSQVALDPLKSDMLDLNTAELDSEEYEVLRKEKLEIAQNLAKKLECAKKTEPKLEPKIVLNTAGKDLEIKTQEEIKALEIAKFEDEDSVGDLRNSDEKLANILETLEKGDFVDLDATLGNLALVLDLDKNIPSYKTQYKKATGEESILIKFAYETSEE